MAGDWIPWCKGLAKKPETLAIARATGMNRRHVATSLMEFWEWADDQTDDGTIPAATLADLCDFVPGTSDTFWLTMVEVGWLVAGHDGLVIPKFDRWLGRSAKKRLKKTMQKRRERENVSPPKGDKKATTGQDRTVSEEDKSSSSSAVKPPKVRKRDELFDTLVEITSSDPKTNGQNLGRVCKALREADPPYTPDEVRRLPAVIAAQGLPSFTFTLNCVPKYIGWVRNPPKKTGTNGGLDKKAYLEDLLKDK